MHTLTNIKLRDADAKVLYALSSGRLSRLKFVSPSQHKKHFKIGLDADAVVKNSRNGPSLFFRNYTSENIKRAFWTWFLDYFDVPMSFEEFCARERSEFDLDDTPVFEMWAKFEKQEQFRVALDCLRTIGAVEGQSTQFACFNIGVDADVVHAYPISKTEAVNLMPAGLVRGATAFE